MIKSFFFAIVFLVGLAAQGSANTITFTGDTTGQPTFDRPTETGARSAIGATVPFLTYQVDVLTAGLFNFSLIADDPSSYDTFLHIFSGTFNPADTSDPAANFLAASDDLNPSNSDAGSGLTNLSLLAGHTYFLVVDGFGSSDFGAYTATISSANGIFQAGTVPETGSSLALLGLALSGLALTRKNLRCTAG